MRFFDLIINVLNKESHPFHHSVSVFAIVLTATFLFSIPLTGVAVFTYLFARFLLHVRNDGREGVIHWADESRRHFLQSHLKPAPPRRNDRSSDESDESLLLVKPGQTEVSYRSGDHVVASSRAENGNVD